MKFSQGVDNVATANITRRFSAAISQLCNAFTAWVIPTADFCTFLGLGSYQQLIFALFKCLGHTNS
jgi:hypothetical protein